MKIILCLFILIFFGCIGYGFKYKRKRENDFYNYLSEYASVCKSNISLFKNDIVNITDNYIITQKNKNANYNKIFVKSGNVYQISMDFINKYVTDKKDTEIIYNFLNQLGTNDYEFEKKRIQEFLDYLNGKSKNFENLMKSADLKFKVMLAVGAVVCIVIW